MRRLTAALLLIPATSVAQPVKSPCVAESFVAAGETAKCSGILLPARSWLKGARCSEADLKTCQAKRARDRASHARTVVMMARDVTEATARAERWRALAMAPAPALPPRVVIRSRGASWPMVAAISAVALVVGGWLGYKVAQ